MLHENELRENLFGIEPLSPERQQRFREELAEIVEPRLSRGYRLYYMLALAGTVAGIPGAACGLIFDAEHRWIWGLSLLANAAFSGWIYYILRHGAEPLRIMQSMSKVFMGVACIGAMVVVGQGLQAPSLSSVMWAIFGLLVFLLTSFINLWNRVITAERTMREHLLRVEYRVASLDSPPR